MKTYALINHDNGEVITLTADNCYDLFSKAMSQRRYNIHYRLRQEHLTLLSCDAIERTSNATIYRNATTIHEWHGGMDTPLEEVAVGVRAYCRLKNLGFTTIGDALAYIKQLDFIQRLPDKDVCKVIYAIREYDKGTAQLLTRRVNERRLKRGV
jgi:hypothetical protein